MPRLTNIGTQKIDRLILKTYSMVSIRFLHQNSLGRVWFIQNTFLLTNTSIEAVLRLFFLSLSNTNIEFAELKKLI